MFQIGIYKFTEHISAYLGLNLGNYEDVSQDYFDGTDKTEN